MRIGVCLWPQPWPELREHWRAAEQAGFDSAWIFDHLAWRGITPWDDAYASLAAAAAVTERIRLGTIVTSPNFRHPVPTASMIRTIDRVSQGRLDVGIGSGGWTHTSDGDVLGVEWTKRQRTDRFVEWVSQLDTLLTESPANVAGEYWSAHEVTIAPGMVQQPRPPFLIAAEGPRGMSLAAKYGQGWIGNTAPEGGLDTVRHLLDKLRDVCHEHGADYDTLRKVWLPRTVAPWADSAAAFEDTLAGCAEIGLTEVVIYWPWPGTEWDYRTGVFDAICGYVSGVSR